MYLESTECLQSHPNYRRYRDYRKWVKSTDEKPKRNEIINKEQKNKEVRAGSEATVTISNYDSWPWIKEYISGSTEKYCGDRWMAHMSWPAKKPPCVLTSTQPREMFVKLRFVISIFRQTLHHVEGNFNSFCKPLNWMKRQPRKFGPKMVKLGLIQGSSRRRLTIAAQRVNDHWWTRHIGCSGCKRVWLSNI